MQLQGYHESVFSQARALWLEKGASAAPEIARNIYRSINLPEPISYVFPSPLTALLAMPHLMAVHGRRNVIDMVAAIVNRNGFVDQVESRFRIGSQLTDGFQRPLKEQLNPEVFDWFCNWAGAAFRDLGGEKLFQERLAEGLFPGEIKDPGLSSTYLDQWKQVRASQVWWWPFQDMMVFAERPKEIHVESSRGLHREDGPAAAFGDGCKIYAVSGVCVSERIIMRPETITLDEIDGEENGEIRRVLIMKMGPGKYLKESGAKLVDMDSLTLVGSAPRALMVDNRGQKWLIGTDGSTARVYSMPVPREAETCREAHDMISGFSELRLKAEA